MKALEFPNRITIELTNRCNVSCVFCNRQKIAMELGDMDETLYYKIIDEAALHLPVKAVLFFRGESLLVPKLPEYIRYAKKKGIGPIQLASNGLALTEELAQRLAESGLDFISFSMDTLDRKIYENSRLTGNLEASMKQVAYFGDLCRRRKAEGKDAPVTQISTIDLDIYKEGQEEFIRYWQQYADIVRVYYEHDEKGHLVDPGVRKLLIDDSERKPCRKIFTDMIIYWDGRIAMCNYDWDEKSDFGNVKEKSISEIWHGEAFRKIREMHNRDCISDNLLCSDCHHWKIDYTEKGFLGKVYKSGTTQ